MIKTILSLFLLMVFITSAMADDVDQHVYTLMNEYDSNIQELSLVALVHSGEQSIDPLIAILNDTNIDNREKAMITLVAVVAIDDINDSRAVDALIKCLSDEDRNVRVTASSMLSFLIPLGKVNDTAIRYFLTSGAYDDIGKGLQIYGFSSIILNYEDLAIDLLIQMLRDGDEQTKADAAYSLFVTMALNKIDNETVVSELIRSVQEDPNYSVRASSMNSLLDILALGSTDSISALNPLVDLFYEKSDPYIKKQSAMAIGVIGEPAVDPLLDAMSDDDEELREYAALGIGSGALLGTIGSNTRALRPLLQSLESDSNEGVRENCAWSLGWIGNDEALDPLIRSMQYDDYYEVRGRAAEALGRIGDNKAIDPLTRTLLDQDENSDVRSKAALALGWIGDRRAMNALIKALDDDDCTVITNAGLAIKEIVEA